MDFSIFENRYVLDGTLVVLTALHIGSGEEEDGKDAPFLKDAQGNFYIPGSSFRGYLRTKLERLLAKENGFQLYTNNRKLTEAEVYLIFGYTSLKKEKDKEIKEAIVSYFDIDESELENPKSKKVNEIDSMSGKIHIADMKVMTETETITRDGVRIDRDTGSVAKGAKFDYDVVPAGTKFKLTIELENVENYQLQLLGLALRDITQPEGDLFGGKQSRGKGKCQLMLSESMKYIDKSNLKAYLFENKIGTVKVSEKVFLAQDLDLK